METSNDLDRPHRQPGKGGDYYRNVLTWRGPAFTGLVLAAFDAHQVNPEFAREQTHRGARVRHLAGQQFVGVKRHRRRMRHGFAAATGGFGAAGSIDLALGEFIRCADTGRLDLGAGLGGLDAFGRFGRFGLL